ncbi:signal peptidase I [Curtobacterium sp. RRHDQ10]|uniref:signal peptidase I n=1 Tax=Curtobacterium phyllosphaerae TaxID=3413379 RepID=UPI003BF2700D
MTTSRIEFPTASPSSSSMRDVADWARIVIGTLARGVIATILGLALWAAAPAVIGWHPTTVMTGSMEPRLTPGDVVVSRPVAETSLHVGQVILYDDPDMPGELRLHRFHAAGEDGQIITKGDANPQPDSTPIVRSAVHGVAFIRVPYVGTPIVWLREGEWQKLVALVVALAGLALLATVDASLRRDPSDPSDPSDLSDPLDSVGPSGGSGPSDPDATGGGQEARPALVTSLPSVVVAVATRAQVRRTRRARRLRTTGVALTAVLLVTGAGLLLPGRASAAPFSGTTKTTTSFAATSAVAPTSLTCTTNTNRSVTVGWSYGSSDTPASFDVLSAGSSVSNVAGTARSVNLTGSGSGTYTLSVRTNLTTSWTATSSTTVTVTVTNSTARCS